MLMNYIYRMNGMTEDREAELLVLILNAYGCRTNEFIADVEYPILYQPGTSRSA